MMKKPVDIDQWPVAKEVRVRIAPSPTGPLHIGTARTALFNWLFARQKGGMFILRVEDTDRERSSPRWEEEIIEGLLWLGLKWDEGIAYAQNQKSKIKNQNCIGLYGPYRQSERGEIYKKYLEKLLADGYAYYCYCSKEDLDAERQAMLSQGIAPKYGGHCRNLTKPPAGKSPQVIRFKTPGAEVGFKDIIRGNVKFDASLFGDIVIAKDINSPLFNFAGAVDDAEMKISHVIRGEDHISNTPKQILIQKALGFPQPEYAHLPLILATDRSKMSKRFAETSLLDYKTQGYLPEAIVNFLVLLGWHPKEDREVLTVDELIKEFDLRRTQKAGAVFNPEKLDWLQKEHLKLIGASVAAERVKPILDAQGIKTSDKLLRKVLEIEMPRLGKLGEFTDIAGFFFKLPDYAPELLIWQKNSAEATVASLKKTAVVLSEVKEDDFKRNKILSALEPITKELGRGEVLWPLRTALSGLRASPDPIDIAEILGKKEVEARIKTAIEKLGGLLTK